VANITVAANVLQMSVYVSKVIQFNTMNMSVSIALLHSAVKVAKLRGLGWNGHVARMCKARDAYQILVRMLIRPRINLKYINIQ
jgi:hypothetical protein